VRWRPNQVSRPALALLAALSVGALAAAEWFQPTHPQPHLEAKLAAARKMQQAMEVLASARRAAGHAFDPELDPRQTGLVGEAFTPVTVAAGSLRAAQITANPNFAALVVQMFASAGVKPGDAVAVGWTGSLPGANLAVLAAAETMGLRLIPVTSLGAAMYGANDPQFTWLDMEKLLAERGVFAARSVAASLGGERETGRGLGRDARERLRAAVERAGAALLEEPDLDAHVAAMVRLYAERAAGAPIRLYVNVGAGAGSVGSSANARALKPGLNSSIWGLRLERDGAMTRLAAEGLPVVHVDDVEALCERYGYPTDPQADPTPGAGPMFHRPRHSLVLVGCLLAGLLAVFFAVVRLDLRHCLRLRGQADEMP